MSQGTRQQPVQLFHFGAPPLKPAHSFATSYYREIGVVCRCAGIKRINIRNAEASQREHTTTYESQAVANCVRRETLVVACSFSQPLLGWVAVASKYAYRSFFPVG